MDGTPAELEAMSPHHMAVTIKVRSGAASNIRETLQNISGVQKVEDLNREEDVLGYRVLPSQGQRLLADISRCSRDQQWDVVELSQDRGQLDEVFRSLTVDKQLLT